MTYNELFVDGLAKPEEAAARLAFTPALKSFKIAIECPIVGAPAAKSYLLWFLAPDAAACHQQRFLPLLVLR